MKLEGRQSKQLQREGAFIGFLPKTGLTLPPPILPPRILEVLRHLFESQNFLNFWEIFVCPNSTFFFRGKVPQIIN